MNLCPQLGAMPSQDAGHFRARSGPDVEPLSRADSQPSSGTSDTRGIFEISVHVPDSICLRRKVADLVVAGRNVPGG